MKLKNVLNMAAAFIFGTAAVFATVPDVKVKIAEYDKGFEFRMSDGGTWECGSDKGIIEPGKVYKFQGDMIAKALKEYHIVLGSAAYGDEKTLYELETQFSSYRTYRLKIGVPPLPDYPDNRVVYVAAGSYDSEEEALVEQERFSRLNISTWIHTDNIRSAKGRLVLSEGDKVLCEGFTLFQLTSNKYTTLRGVEYAKGFSWSGIEDRTYSDRIWVRWGFTDRIECLELTNLEKLLVGIVPSEISASSAVGALQAQAVAARGEMLSKKGVRHLKEGFDFCSEQHCQVYKGILSSYEDISSKIRPTFGIVLKNSKGRVLDAVYSANCGGHTASNHNIWTSNPDEHLQGVSDFMTPVKGLDLTKEADARKFIESPPAAWCGNKKAEGSDKFRWKKNLTQNDLKAIEKAVGVGKIRTIDSFKREISGRIISMRVAGESGEKMILKELPIRKLLGGASALRSSCFIAQWRKDSGGFIIGGTLTGAGWGHGVGMCQTGAQAQALAGREYLQILQHYFPKSISVKLY